MPLPSQTISLPEVKAIIEAGERRAQAICVKSTIVVVEAGGGLVALARMDGAWRGGADLALGKAAVASGFGTPSGYFAALVQPGQPLLGVGSAASGKYLPIGGGFLSTSTAT